MKSSFTDLFIRRPVLAIVVNVVIIIAGLQAWRSLSIRQYPRQRERLRRRLHRLCGRERGPRARLRHDSARTGHLVADGIDYIESQSLLGVSIITARLKLNYDQTQALADITAKVNQVRNDLPPRPRCPPSTWSRRIRKWRPPT